MSMGQQLPGLSGSAHETHPPSQARLQHTPSAQNVDAHSLPSLHAAPFDLRPQLPATHFCPGAHSASCVHVEKHACVVGSHENGAHVMIGPLRQWPDPSQASPLTTAVPSHVPAPQDVPAVY